jgi:DNA-binding NarL/FixJ family response regulator
MRVLIAEDEPLVALHLELLVTEFGHVTCAIAASADDAVAQAGAHSPDIVLMDIRLGIGGSGIDAAGPIHARMGLRRIFLSAKSRRDNARGRARLDPIAFVGKPILP